MIKKSLYLVFFSGLIVCTVFGQPILTSREKSAGNTSGVYLTAADYSNGKLTPVTEDSISKNKVRLHRVIGKYIEVIAAGKTYRYHKDSVFGYRNLKQEDYRLYTNTHDEYRIAECRDIMIYILPQPVYGVKNFILAPFYYFSITPGSPIIPLSVINIKRAFPNSYPLHHYLDLEFDETTISGYDKARDMYKINYVLNQLKKINQE